MPILLKAAVIRKSLGEKIRAGRKLGCPFAHLHQQNQENPHLSEQTQSGYHLAQQNQEQLLIQLKQQLEDQQKKYELEKYQKAHDIILEYLSEKDNRFDDLKVDEKGFVPITVIDLENLPEDSPPIDSTYFYSNFVAKHIPVVFKNGAKDWPAFENWQNDTYIADQIGEENITVYARKDFGNTFSYFLQNRTEENFLYKDFVKEYMSPNRTANYYWKKFGIPQGILKDLREPDFALFMEIENTSIWQGASGTDSLPHIDGQDNLLVQISGHKRTVLLPPTESHKIYYGMKNLNLQIENYSELDFFEPDYENFPLFKNVKGKMYVETEPGDILYIPSHWWHQVKSAAERNIAINLWYKPNVLQANLYYGVSSQFNPNYKYIPKSKN